MGNQPDIGQGKNIAQGRISIDMSEADRAVQKARQVAKQFEDELNRINRTGRKVRILDDDVIARTLSSVLGKTASTRRAIVNEVDQIARAFQRINASASSIGSGQLGSRISSQARQSIYQGVISSEQMERQMRAAEREIERQRRISRQRSIRFGQSEINATQAALTAVNTLYLQRVERFREIRSELPLGMDQTLVRNVRAEFSRARQSIIAQMQELRQLRAEMQQIRLDPNAVVPPALIARAEELRRQINTGLIQGVQGLDRSLIQLQRSGSRSMAALAVEAHKLAQALIPIGLGIAGATGLGVRSAAQRERLEFRFRNIFGDAKEAENALKTIADRARELNIPVMRAQEAMLRYIPTIGNASDKMRQLLDLTVRLASIDPGTGGGIEGAAFAINEALSSIFDLNAKKPQDIGGDLLSLTERFGLSRLQLRQAIFEEGDFLAGLDKYLTKIGATTRAAEQFGQTFTGAMTLATGSLQDMMATAFEPATEGLAGMLSGISQLSMALDENAPVVLRFIGNFLTLTATISGLLFVISNVIPAITALNAALKGITLFGMIGGGLSLGPVVAALTAIAVAITAVGEAIRFFQERQEKLNREAREIGSQTTTRMLEPDVLRFRRRVELDRVGRLPPFTEPNPENFIRNVRELLREQIDMYEGAIRNYLVDTFSLTFNPHENREQLIRYIVEEVEALAEKIGIAFSFDDQLELNNRLRELGETTNETISEVLVDVLPEDLIKALVSEGTRFTNVDAAILGSIEATFNAIHQVEEIAQNRIDRLGRLIQDRNNRYQNAFITQRLGEQGYDESFFRRQNEGQLRRDLVRLLSSQSEFFQTLSKLTESYGEALGRARQQLLIKMQDEADDFWRNRLRQDQDFQKQLLQFDQQAAQAEAQIQQQIVQLQNETNKQTIDAIEKFNKESARQLEDHMNNLAKIRRDASDDIEDAVARRDFAAAFRRIRDRDKAIADAELQYNITQQRRLEDLNDLIANLEKQKQERLADYIQQLVDLRKNNLERRAEMIKEFYERRSLEDEDRRIRLERERRDLALAQYYRERDFQRQIQDLIDHNEVVRQIRENGFTGIEEAWRYMLDNLISDLVSRTSQQQIPPGGIFAGQQPVVQGGSYLFGQGLQPGVAPLQYGSGLIGPPVYLGSSPGGISFSAPPGGSLLFGSGFRSVPASASSGSIIINIPFTVNGVVDGNIVDQIIARAEETIVPAIGRTIRSVWSD